MSTACTRNCAGVWLMNEGGRHLYTALWNWTNPILVPNISGVNVGAVRVGNHRFRHFETWGKVYTEIVPDASKATLQKVIRGRVGIESIINTDGWRGYQGLVDMGLAKHFRVHHGNNEFVRGANGIESFWSYAKHRLV